MKRETIVLGVLAGMLAIGLTACADSSDVNEGSTVVAQQPAVSPMPTLSIPTVAPAAPDIGGLNEPSDMTITLGVSGSGEVKAAQEADLVFTVQGTVDQVLVEEGDVVKKDQVLAVLDPRPFEQQIRQAEAGLARAEAQLAALTEDPRNADLAAAQAQVEQAQAALDRVLAGPKDQDIESARAALAAAQANLQSNRDRLSQAKINAQLQIDQAANNLRNAQDNYSRIYWANRELEDFLSKFGDELPQENKDQEEAALRAVENAETALEQARVAYEQAKQAEITGIQAVEQQVIQAQATLDKLLLPPDEDRVAAAEAQLASAQAQLDRLQPDPTDSQLAQAVAGVDQARASLEQARLNREYAELHAPFDGTVSIVNIDPGDPGATGGLAAIQVVDASKLHIDVQISDVDIARVAVGQKATIFADALPNQTFNGSVDYVAPTAAVLGNIRTYLVRIVLDEQEGLRAGMSVRVELAAE